MVLFVFKKDRLDMVLENILKPRHKHINGLDSIVLRKTHQVNETWVREKKMMMN
jgi:hypothetical protein